MNLCFLGLLKSEAGNQIQTFGFEMVLLGMCCLECIHD